VFRKILKWFGYFALVGLIMLGAVYVYLSMQTGEKATERAVFQRKNSPVLVFAHRGGGGLYPENTLEAFEYSAKTGADVLELDVHGTADGILVVMHDGSVNRTTDGSGKVSEMTLEALKKLDAGYRFSTDNGQTFPFRGRGIAVPTLEEIFAALPEMTFNIEPKQAEPSIIAPLCSLIRARKMTEKVIVGSFRQAVIDEFRRTCPEIATSATPSEATEFLTLSKTGLSESYSPPMQALQIPENLGALSVVTKEFVENAHRKNLKVHVWTINETSDMERLIKIGVDGIMTDYPDRLLNLLGRSMTK
jgi:glycerophosphoryl diester phosphodiesterase